MIILAFIIAILYLNVRLLYRIKRLYSIQSKDINQ